MKIGRYAGEIVDIQSDAAHRLLNAGSAEDPYAPPVDPVPFLETRKFSRAEIAEILTPVKPAVFSSAKVTKKSKAAFEQAKARKTKPNRRRK